MNQVEKYMAFINQHYRVLKREDLIKLAYRFSIELDIAINAMHENGWETEEGLEGYFNPSVKDRKSMIDKTDFKINQTDEDYIDDTENHPGL